MNARAWREAEATLTTIADVLRFVATASAAAPLYFGHGTEDAWDDAVALVCGSLDIPEDRLQPLLAARLTRGEVQRVLGRARRRVEQRIPVPYLTGRAHFAGLEFLVTRDVLIPRSPIAELIGREFAPWLDGPPRRVLDLCTGSGCIGLACGVVFPEADLVLSDISIAALTVAARNCERLGLATDRVQLRCSDLLADVSGRFDLIVCNPPYVPATSYAALPAEYRHEPRLALEAADDGKALVLRILQAAPDYLEANGVLVLEVGEIAPSIAALLADVEHEWPAFEQGGEGVLVIGAAALAQFVQSRPAAFGS